MARFFQYAGHKYFCCFLHTLIGFCMIKSFFLVGMRPCTVRKREGKRRGQRKNDVYGTRNFGGKDYKNIGQILQNIYKKFVKNNEQKTRLLGYKNAFLAKKQMIFRMFACLTESVADREKAKNRK